MEEDVPEMIILGEYPDAIVDRDFLRATLSVDLVVFNFQDSTGSGIFGQDSGAEGIVYLTRRQALELAHKLLEALEVQDGQ